MGIRVLGPLQVDGQADGLSPRDRVVLSALVVRAGDGVTSEVLADALWGDQLPASWAKVVQGCVMRLRKSLGNAAIESGAFGYRLVLHDDELDHRLFERLLERGREALAGGDPARASYLVREALDLWRGQALADLEEWGPGRVEAGRLEGLRMDAEELYVEAETASGHSSAVLERARALVAQAPFRERRWALLATALYQSGRQPEALGAVKRARTMLVDELGLDPGRELVDLEQQLLRQDPSLSAPEGREVSAVCPYRGLLPYGAEDAESYFGREDDVAACLRRLRDHGVLAVVGPSGIGKSSLVRAGVVASLARDGIPVLVTTPGTRPMDSLSGLKPRGRQTLVVDQAEEAVTVATDPAERERYFAALAAHVGAGGGLILSLRADHLGDLAPYADIARVLEDGLYLLGPMGEADLRSAIEGPARRAGLRLEPGLVDLLVREVEGEPAALPMLSHVLRETWERREGPTLTVDGYRATGGIRSAVSQSAEGLYDAMDAGQRSQLRSLLLRLVVPTEDGEPVRARVPRATVAVDDEHARLVERLVGARLVAIDGDTVQIAHEALVRVWPRLRGWLDDDVEGQRLFRHLAGAATAWDGMGRPDSELYRGARLVRTLEWRDRADPDLNDVEADFLAASAALSASELRAAETRIAQQRRANRRLRTALAGVGVLLVVALVAGLLAVRTSDRARNERDLAEAAANLADARRAEAQALIQDKVDQPLLLAVAALQVDQSPQAWSNLGSILLRTRSLVAVGDSEGYVVSLATSPDGSLLAASRPGSGAGNGLRLFDARSLAPVAFHDDIPASAVEFSPDGTQVVFAVNQWVPTAGSRRIDPWPIRLYDLPGATRSSRQLGGMPEGSSVEYALDFSADGTRVAALVQHYVKETHEFTKFGRAMVWDLSDPAKPEFSVGIPEYALTALSPDGRRLYAAMKGDVPLRVYDVDSGRLLRSNTSRLLTTVGLTELGPEEFALSADGSTLAVAVSDLILRFDAVTLEPLGHPLRAHTDGITDLEYSHHGELLLSSSVDGTAIVWDAVGSAVNRFDANSGELTAAAFSADDRTVYTTANGQILVWDVTGKQDLLPAGGSSEQAKQSYDVTLPAPDGHTIARMRFGKLWFVDDRTGRQTARTPIDVNVLGYGWSPDSRWLLTSGAQAALSVWDPVTARLVGRTQFPKGSDLRSGFSSSGDLIYVAPGDGTLVTLDRSSLRPAYQPVDVGSDIVDLQVDRRGGPVILVKSNGSVLKVEPEAGTVEASPPLLVKVEEPLPVLSPDGTLLAAGHPYGGLGLLDLATWEWVREPDRTEPGPYLHYAPDGSQVASVSADRIRLWDGHTGVPQASFPLPDAAHRGWLEYLPDSSGLFASVADGRTYTISTRTSTWVERACRLAARNLTQDEWAQFFPNRPYQVACPQWPAGT